MSKSPPIDDRIHALTIKKQQIGAQIMALDAKRQQTKKKDEDRLKWLLGSLVFERFSAEPALQNIVERDLPDRLTQRDRDRELWDILFSHTLEDQA
jgi:hypothetical protein